MTDDAGYFARSRTELAGFLPGDYSRVLEVGCGEGAFARRLQRASEVWGIEPAAGAARAASRSFSRLLQGTYEEVQAGVPEGYFDLVVCNDVIEHMRDHDAFLESIKSKLRPGGYLVGSIPNVRYVRTLYELLVERDWRYVDAGILDRTHLRFFTRRSLERTFLEHGFAIERLAGINSALAGPVSARALLKRVAVTGLIVATLGLYGDTRFAQFGFRLRAPSGGRNA